MVIVAKSSLTAKVWRVALDTGAKVLALNVIEAAGSNDKLVQKRNDLNAMIAKHGEERLYVYIP